jgi:hypothetical protein
LGVNSRSCTRRTTVQFLPRSEEISSAEELRGPEKYLAGKYGVSKIFRDFMTSDPGILSQRSAYRGSELRKHEHYIIGLLITPLEPGEWEAAEIKSILERTFERNQKLYLRAGETGSGFRNDRRHMARYSTVALTVFDPGVEHPGMVASFTVLGSTRKLSASWAANRKT